MSITIQCPNAKCQQIVTAEESISGRNVKCKKCGTAFRATPTLDGTSSETSPKANTQDGGLFAILPAEFGRYRVEKLLGKGGMGAVYLALDSQLNRRVALKIPFFDAREEPKRLERFLREARSAARLHHPNICTVYDVGELQGRPFITMAFITGKPLEDLFDEDRLLPVPQVIEIVRKTAFAVQEAHNLSIIHRDLKPANIMITPAGEPVIMDFGLAKLVGETDALETRLTQEGALLGTPKYMAPEQVNGDQQSIGPATDVYALGVILFELLTGKTPYGGPLLQMLSQIASAPVPNVRDHRSDLDESLDRVCRRAMSKRPADRFATMTELAEALGASGNSAEPIRQARSKGIETAALSGKGQAPPSGSGPLVVPSPSAHVSETNRRQSVGKRSVKVPAKVNSRSVRNRLPVWAWILSAATGLLLAGMCGAYFFRNKGDETEAITAQIEFNTAFDVAVRIDATATSATPMEASTVASNSTETKTDASEFELSIEATVLAVDLEKRSLVVQSNSKTITFDLSRKTSVKQAGVATSLDSIAVGQKTTIVFDPEINVITGIEIMGAATPQQLAVVPVPSSDKKIGEPVGDPDSISIDVTIESIDLEKRSVTVLRKLKSSIFDVSRKAKITVDGSEASLETLQTNQSATITFDPEFEVISRIEVQTSSAEAKPSK